MANKERAKAEVLQGTLDLMLLQTLATVGPLHGLLERRSSRTGLRRRTPSQYGDALPWTDAAGTARPCPLRVERDRQQPEGALLQHHRSRTPTTRHRKGGMGSHDHH